MSNGRFGTSSGHPILISHVQCRGEEGRYIECPYVISSEDDAQCSPAGVICES